MRKKVYTLLVIIFISIIAFSRVVDLSGYNEVATKVFLLINFAAFSSISFLTYRYSLILKKVEYYYLLVICIILTLIIFTTLIHDPNYLEFVKYYFYKLRYIELVMYFFAFYILKSIYNIKSLHRQTIFLILLIFGLLILTYNYNLNDYILVSLYLLLIFAFYRAKETILKELSILTLEFKLISELFILLYLKYPDSLFLFLGYITYSFSLYILFKFFIERVNFEYKRILKKKDNRINGLIESNEKSIILVEDERIIDLNLRALHLIGAYDIDNIIDENINDYISCFENLHSRKIGKKITTDLKKVNGENKKVELTIKRMNQYDHTDYLLEINDSLSFDDLFYRLNDTIGNIVYIYTKEGYQYVSQSVQDVLGYTPFDFYSDKWFTRQISIDSRFEDLIRSGGDGLNYLGKYKNKDGKIRYLKESIERIEINDSFIYYGIATDVTEFILELNKSLSNNESLYEENLKKDMAMSIVSHEIRSPITAIIGFSENILIHNDKIEKTILNMIKKVYNNSMRLKELIDNLLDINRLNAGKFDVYLEKCNAKKLIDEILLNNEILFQIKKIHCVNMLKDDVEILCDSSMLYQIVNNIITNAIKYNKEGGSIIIDSEIEKNETIISIKDSGIGIAKDNKNRIFSEYERIQGTKEKGTGLGLPLVKKLIELNGGSIWFDSEENVGSTFYLKFKL